MPSYVAKSRDHARAKHCAGVIANCSNPEKALGYLLEELKTTGLVIPVTAEKEG